MNRRDFLKTASLAVAAPGSERRSCDAFVYGSTPGGAAVAVEAARAHEQSIEVAAIDPNPLPAALKIQIDPYA